MLTTRLPDNEALYLAGIFDGEGTINISRRGPETHATPPRFFLRVAVDMNHLPTVETFHRYFGGQLYVARHRLGTGHMWMLRHNDVRPFLQAIGPLLRIKDAQARLAIEFLDAHTFEHHSWHRRPVAARVIADRVRMYERMGELNQSHWWKKRHRVTAA